MIRSQHVESGAALLFAGVLVLVIWQPEVQWLFWPIVAISAAGTFYALFSASPAERARRAHAIWVVPFTFFVLAGIYAWLAPGLNRGGSMQLAGILMLVGGGLIWARRRVR